MSIKENIKQYELSYRVVREQQPHTYVRITLERYHLAPIFFLVQNILSIFLFYTNDTRLVSTRKTKILTALVKLFSTYIMYYVMIIFTCVKTCNHDHYSNLVALSKLFWIISDKY